MRDSSVPAQLGAVDRLPLDSNKESLKKAIGDCCKKFKIGCDIDVIFNENLEKPKNDAPEGAYGQKGEALNNYRNNSGNSGNGSIDVLLTSLPIAAGEAEGLAAEGGGVVMNPRSPGYTLPHEAGHCVGYDCGDEEYGQHSSKEDSLMGQMGGSEVDECHPTD